MVYYCTTYDYNTGKFGLLRYRITDGQSITILDKAGTLSAPVASLP